MSQRRGRWEGRTEQCARGRWNIGLNQYTLERKKYKRGDFLKKNHIALNTENVRCLVFNDLASGFTS